MLRLISSQELDPGYNFLGIEDMTFCYGLAIQASWS